MRTLHWFMLLVVKQWRSRGARQKLRAPQLYVRAKAVAIALLIALADSWEAPRSIRFG
jgi:hypothetical protein